MLTKTREQTTLEESIENPGNIAEQVEERGFYLYEWISPDELRMTLERDYLQIVRWASIPLAIITGIFWFIGLGAGIIGSIFAILWVLAIFYGIVGIILFFRFLYRSYMYTRGANVVITDSHYVQWGNVLDKNNPENIRNAFRPFEEMFDETFLGTSNLLQKKEHAKKALFENLKEIMMWGGKLIEKVGWSRESGGIIAVIVIAGILYGIMMGIVYFIGIFFIAIFGRIFSWWAHRYLLATSNTEHVIQTLFSKIDTISKQLSSEKWTTISLLDEAYANAWKENLLGKMNTSIELLGSLAGNATDDTIQLRSILESSKYKNIFNFSKYGNWIKIQILEPIESILLLLQKNHDIIGKTILMLDTQISETSDPSLQKPLELQKERLLLQKESFERVMQMLEGYKKKLTQ